MNRIDEINKELTVLMGIDSNQWDWEQIERLQNEKELLEPEKSLNLHYNTSVTIGQIQLAAKVVRAWLTDDPYRNNLHLIDCPIPNELKDDWRCLGKLALLYSSRRYFYIKTPNFGTLRYAMRRSRQISDIETNLHLATAQKTLKKLCEETEDFTLRDADSLVNSFILINNAISHYFFIKADDTGVFEWTNKYSPCFFERKHILNFRGMMMPEIQQNVDNRKLALCRKYFMNDYTMQIKYLTFWVSLLDVATFPGLPQCYKVVYNNLIDYLLENYANIYIYDIVAESAIVKNANYIETRGSESNTTRVKIFFTMNDDKPQLLRLDLPHIDHPYVHINHENAEGIINKHVRLSDDVIDGSLDNVFASLVETLQCYDFYGIDTRHSPVSDDKAFFHEMQYLAAMYSYAIVARAYLLLGDDSKVYNQSFIKLWRIKLIGLLREDGLDGDDINNLDPFSLLELADEIICKNKTMM